MTYRNTKVQTAAPPDANAFEQAYGHPATMSDLEHRVGLAGNGRYSGPDDELHGAIFGAAFVPSLGEPVEPGVPRSTYIDSGFQVMSYELRKKAVLKAKIKASKTASTFRILAEEDGYNIWAESKEEMIIHSEQFGFDIQLDARGNAPENVDLTGHYLRNIYKEDMATKRAREAATAAKKVKSSLLPPSITAVKQQPIRPAAQSTSSPPRAIPALAPATAVMDKDSPEEKAARGKVATKKESWEKSSIDKSPIENALNAGPPEQPSPVADFIEWPFVPEESHNNEYYDEYPSAYESNWANFIRYDPVANVPSPRSSARKFEQEPPLPTRKRKGFDRANDEQASISLKGKQKRLQTTFSRCRSVNFSEPRLAKDEPLDHPANRNNYHSQHVSKKNGTKPSELDVHGSRKAVLSHNETPYSSRKTHRQTRYRSKSPHHSKYHDQTLSTCTDRRQKDRHRERSRSPERTDVEADRKVRHRKELTLDTQRDVRTHGELGHESHAKKDHHTKDGHVLRTIDRKADHNTVGEIKLSPTLIPTPPESNKSTPPRATSDAEGISPTEVPAATQSKSSSSYDISNRTKRADQNGQKSLTQSGVRRTPGYDGGTKSSTKNEAPKKSNAVSSPATQKKNTMESGSSHKRCREEDDDFDKDDRGDSVKRPKKEMKTSAKRDGQNGTVRNDGDAAYTKSDAKDHLQHALARTEKKNGEGAKVPHKTNKEDIEREKKLKEAEQKKRDIKARIAERHANRAPRARASADMERWVPRQMRQNAPNTGSNTNNRGGQRDFGRNRRH